MLTGALSCKKRFYFPVKLEEIATSSVYKLIINNLTSGPILFAGIYDKTRNKKVPVGKSFNVLLKLKSIKIGDAITREVVPGPYIDNGLLGPDKAYIYFIDHTGIHRKFVIDLKSVSFFKERSPETVIAAYKILKVTLTDDDLDKLKWFTKNDCIA